MSPGWISRLAQTGQPQPSTLDLIWAFQICPCSQTPPNRSVAPGQNLPGRQGEILGGMPLCRQMGVTGRQVIFPFHGQLPRAERAAGPAAGAGADACLPGMSFLTAPPHLLFASVAHRLGRIGAVQPGFPLAQEMQSPRSHTILLKRFPQDTPAFLDRIPILFRNGPVFLIHIHPFVLFYHCNKENTSTNAILGIEICDFGYRNQDRQYFSDCRSASSRRFLGQYIAAPKSGIFIFVLKRARIPAADAQRPRVPAQTRGKMGIPSYETKRM